jgi:hypothetical protein
LALRKANKNNTLAHSQACKPFNLCKSNPWFNCYPENTALLRTKFEYLLQDFKLCEINFAMFTAQCNFEADKADEGTEMDVFKCKAN